ncbi:MAG: hypothetical protein WKF54_04825 [Nocardioidaceae bacterium]
MNGQSRRGPEGTKRVFLHIGAPKTGTTYLQHVLFKNREALAADGVLYPYSAVEQSFRSAHDFCGSPWFGHDAGRFRGEWARIAELTRNWDGETVIISSELLAAARPDRIRSRLDMLEPAETHVVFSARDLARQLVSDWQEQVKHKHTVTLERFVDDLVELGHDAPEPFGRLFWGMHDAAFVLGCWVQVVPPERIHVITLPPPGGAADALWTRFCTVTGLDPQRYDTSARRSNTSMGVSETELVRRMNSRLRRMDGNSYDVLVRLFLAEKVLGGGTTRLTLPPHRAAWAAERSRTLIDELTAAGYRVEGDLEDLMPSPPDTAYVSPTALTDADLGPVAIRAASALLRQAGKLREQNRRLQAALEGDPRSRAGRRVLERVVRAYRARRGSDSAGSSPQDATDGTP